MTDKVFESRWHGGPAFPHEYETQSDGRVIYHGLTARDYFAAQALNGLLAADVGDDQWNSYGAMIDRAWELADMMLAARKAKP